MKNKSKFAVLGAGHGGRAIAAYLAAIGHDVSLFNRTPENIQTIKQAGGIFLTFTADLEEYLFPTDMKVHKFGRRHEHLLFPETEKIVEEDLSYIFGRIKTISSDIEKVLKDRDIIMVAVPARGHRYMAEKCAPYLKDGQLVLLNPGRCFGALEFCEIVNDYYEGKKKPDVTIAEAQTLIYACRRTKPRNVRIFAVKNSVGLAAIPSKNASHAMGLLKDVYPQFTPKDSVLETSLGNLGGIFHVPTTILNATRIDMRHNFRYYAEGITKHAASIIEDVDKERMAIARAMDVEAISARRWLHQTYDSEGADLYEAIRNTYAYRKIESPKTINHRYIWEDVPTGLVPLSSLGKQLDVSTPMIDSFIHLATSAFKKDFNIDFFKIGRTMEKLGLAGMNIDEIKKFVKTGNRN